MPVTYCQNCGMLIDLDTDVEHEQECQEEMESFEETIARLKAKPDKNWFDDMMLESFTSFPKITYKKRNI